MTKLIVGLRGKRYETGKPVDYYKMGRSEGVKLEIEREIKKQLGNNLQKATFKI